MHHDKGSALAIGTLFIVAAIASIIALALYAPVLNNPNYIIHGGAGLQIGWAAVLEIITAFAIIGTSIALFPILKEYNERFALAAVCFRTAEAIVIIIGILCLLTIVTLNSHWGFESNSDAFVVAGKLLVAFHNWTFLYGPNVLLGPSTFMTAYILYQTKMVPRFISIAGLIGGPMIFTCGVLVTLGMFNQLSLWGTLFAIPVFVYEMSLAVYMLRVAFKRQITRVAY